MNAPRPAAAAAIAIAAAMAAIAAAAEPSYRLTVGSEFILSAADAGLDSFRGAVAVFAMDGRKVVTVASQPARASASGGHAALRCSWKAALPPGLYPLWVEAEDATGTRKARKVTDFLAVAPPSIHRATPANAKAGGAMEVEGDLFSARCRVWMSGADGVRRPCRILTPRAQWMDSATGRSAIRIAVPEGIASAEGARLVVASPVGSDAETVDAELAAAAATVYAVTVGDLHETSRHLARLSNFIQAFKAAHPGRTIALHAGDQLSAYPRASYDPPWARDLYTADPATHGVAMMALMSAMPFDAGTLGNHDLCLGAARLLELLRLHPQPLGAVNLGSYDGAGLAPWPPGQPPHGWSFHLRGLDVGVVAASSTYQNHWANTDKPLYKVANPMDATVLRAIRASSLLNDAVILITHQNDVSDIIPVYGAPTPTGQYFAACDIYTLADIAKVALILGGHEHKNYFRRASYSGDNSAHALYVDKVYNPDSRAVLVKSSRYFGQYAGVLRLRWSKAERLVESITLMEGLRGADGKYLGCAESQMAPVDDGGLIQELDESPWDPRSTSRWWKMDDWPWEDTRPLFRR